MSIATDDPTDQDLERHLRRAFAQAATEAPLSHPDAPIFDRAPALAAGNRSPGHVLLGATASLVLIAAGIVALAHRPTAPTQSTSSTPFVPDGTEYPLVETAPNERTALGRGNMSELVAPGVLWAATPDATFAVYRSPVFRWTAAHRDDVRTRRFEGHQWKWVQPHPR